MPAQKPEDLDRLFEDYLNRGDLDASLTLYEPDAAMAEMSGGVAVGYRRLAPVHQRLSGHEAAD